MNATVLADALAPVLRDLVDDAVGPLLRRLDALEAGVGKALPALETLQGEISTLPAALERQVSGALADLPDRIAAAAEALPRAPTAEEVAALIPAPAPGEPGKSVTLDDVRPMVDDTIAAALATMPTPRDGKDVDPVAVKAMVDEAVAAAAPAETIAAAIEKAVAARPLPTAKEVRDLIVEEVTRAMPSAEAVSALMPAPPTAEAVAALVRPDQATIKAAVDAAVATLPSIPTAAEVASLIPAPAPGKDADPEQVAALVAAEVQKQVAALPAPQPGRDADPEVIKAMVAEAVADLPPAKDGRDATPEQIAAAVEKVLATWERPKDGASVTIEDLRPVVDQAVEKAVAALPVQKDGVGLADALIDRDGGLVLTLTDGTLKALGVVVGKDGEPGAAGTDGLGFDDLDVVDDGMGFVLRFSRGDQVKEFRVAKPTLADCYRGVWREGAHKAGDAVTWGGSLWIAQRDTEAKPETDDSWRLAVKKGRDGKDGRDLTPPAKATVKL